jgi:cyclophilin family peptidyl-prolyl cis-trans isomerase
MLRIWLLVGARRTRMPLQKNRLPAIIPGPDSAVPSYGGCVTSMKSKLLWSVLLGSLALIAQGCGAKEDAPPTANIKSGEGGGAQRPKLDHVHPVVQIRTTAGEILIQLDGEHAPVTVSNFLAYVNSGQYNGTLFHDVEAGFIVLGGGYDADLREKPADFAIRNEAHNGLLNVRGAIAMARRPDVIDSSTSMFFINVADNATLDHKGEAPDEYGYCVFGKVIEGMEIVDKIANSPTKAVGQFERMPEQRIAIQSVRRVR